MLNRKAIVILLFYILSLVPQKSAQAHPIAIAIPEAAVATYAAITSILVGSTVYFAAAKLPDIVGIEWKTLFPATASGTQLSGLNTTTDLERGLSLALSDLHIAYNQLVTDLEMADLSLGIEQSRVESFFLRVQATCNTFKSNLDCAVLSASFQEQLSTAEFVLLASEASYLGSELVPITAAMAETNFFATEGTDSDCNSSQFFNAYNGKYDLSRDAVSNIHASMNGGGGTVSEFITMFKKGGGWGCHAIGKRRTLPTDAAGNQAHTFNLRFVPYEYYNYVKPGVPQDNRVKRYLMCMGWRLEKGLNDTTCAEKMKYDACERAVSISRFCAKDARLR